mgnify:CR=1 FL=1
MRYLNKRGISPLIATILLIGFTVALAAVVITWGSGFVDRITSGTEDRATKALACTSDLNFEIRAVTCPNKVLIENKGDIDIVKFTLRFFNGGGVATQALAGLNQNEIKEFILNPNMPAGTNRVEGIATVKIDGQDITCSETVKERDFAPAC